MCCAELACCFHGYWLLVMLSTCRCCAQSCAGSMACAVLCLVLHPVPCCFHVAQLGAVCCLSPSHADPASSGAPCCVAVSSWCGFLLGPCMWLAIPPDCAYPPHAHMEMHQHASRRTSCSPSTPACQLNTSELVPWTMKRMPCHITASAPSCTMLIMHNGVKDGLLLGLPAPYCM